MDYQTDYVSQQISDLELRDLLIKSRNNNTYVPVYYQGKKYWCLEELTEEQQAIGREKAIKEMLVYGIISFVALISAMYGFAYIFLPPELVN
jgi:hypothetical protein